MDWLLSLPDPREDDGAEGGVLRPLRPSATQPRLPSHKTAAVQGGTAAAAAAAAGRRPGQSIGSAGRARRPGSAQHPSKLGRTPYGLAGAAPPSSNAGVAGSISVSGGLYHPMAPSSKAGPTKAAPPPLPQPPSASASGVAGVPGVLPGGLARATLGSSATDPAIRNPASGLPGAARGVGGPGSSGLTRTQSGMLPPRKELTGGAGGAVGPANFSRGLPRCSSNAALAPYSQLVGGGAPAAASTVSTKRVAASGALGVANGAGGGGGSGRAAHAGGAAERGAADGAGGAGFRSEALQLEVRLAEGLQALADSMSAGEASESATASKRLALCRTLFERIIERDVPFGRLLARVKLEFENSLKAASTPAEPELEAAQSDLAAAQRDVLHAKSAIAAVQDENAMLRAELQAMGQREGQLRAEVRAYPGARLTTPHHTSLHLTTPPYTSPHLTTPHHTSPYTSLHLTAPHHTSLHLTSSHHISPHLPISPQVRAYQEHAYEMQQHATQQAEAEQAAMNAELERELPASARPGEVTHRLGGDVTLCDVSDLPPPPPRPKMVPALDMSIVYQKKDADTKAEADDERARQEHEKGHGGSHQPGDDRDDDDDDDEEGSDEEDEEEERALEAAEYARLVELQKMVRNLPQSPPIFDGPLQAGEMHHSLTSHALLTIPPLVPRGMPYTHPNSLGATWQVQAGEIDPSRIPPELLPALEAIAMPRVLKPAEAAEAAAKGGAGGGAIPGLDLRSLKDPSQRPEVLAPP